MSDEHYNGMSDALDAIRDPGTHPIGAPGSVRRQLQEIGQELLRLRERVQATAEVGCVNSPSGRRWPMKCLPRDPCSFCRAKALLASLARTA